MYRSKIDSRDDNALIPIYLLPGLGAQSAVVNERSEISPVYDVLKKYGEVTMLLHLPDVNCRSRECTDFESVVSALKSKIATRCAPSAPVIVGYSIGGFIAFEICRRLEREGLPVKLLIMLDTSAVYIPAPKKPLIAQCIEAARKGPKSALARWPFIVAMRFGRLELARVWISILRTVFGASQIRWMRLDLLVAYWMVIVRRFELCAYGRRVVLFKAKKGRPRILDKALGWTPYISDLDVIEVDGDHWSMLRNSSLLEALDATLARLN